jgi:leucyl aminopeptidase
MQLAFAPYSPEKASILVVSVWEDNRMSKPAVWLDVELDGLLSKAISAGNFKGKKGQTMLVTPPSHWQAVLLIGIGKPEDATLNSLQQLGGLMVKTLNRHGFAEGTFILQVRDGSPWRDPEVAAHIAYGAQLGAYRFDKYHTTMEEDKKPTLQNLTIMLADYPQAETLYAPLAKIADAVCFTRDLVSEPANIINPPSLALQCRSLESLGVSVEVLGEEKMAKLGMGALLGVGQGSAFESQLVVMEYRGAPESSEAPIAFVGKGVTFDSGGISIKPAGGMEEMKWDMGGSGTVIGLMKALAGRKAKVNAIGVVGLVENMPSGTAQRPGDVVRSMSGQTIEVLNTDAEGRLVLADALWYTQDRFKPRFMIDLATLTGAIIVSLGSSRAGLFSNNDELAERIAAASKEEGEQVWRLPLGKEYDEQINSDIADMQNIGKEREAGSITAAQFLQRFVNDLPWAHLDIAGVAWSKKDTDTCPKGATAFGVRLLNRLVADYYEG